MGVYPQERGTHLSATDGAGDMLAVCIWQSAFIPYIWRERAKPAFSQHWLLVEVGSSDLLFAS